MEKNKIYKVAGMDFILNTDLDLDEAEEVQNFFSNATSVEGSVNLGNFKKEEVMKLYSIILKPVGGKELPKDFSFSKIKESVQIEAIRDFFLSRIKKISGLQSSLSGSTEQP